MAGSLPPGDPYAPPMDPSGYMPMMGQRVRASVRNERLSYSVRADVVGVR